MRFIYTLKVHVDSYVLIPVINNLLRLLFPIPEILSSVASSNTTQDDHPMDVKLVSSRLGNNLNAFEMAFLLNQLGVWNMIKRWKQSILFGKIVGGENVIDAMSRTTCLDRGGYTIFVDYRIL